MSSELKILKNSDTIIISFGGNAQQFLQILPFEFLNFLNKHFEDFDKYFYIDKNKAHYHKGIEGISNNINETTEYLKNIINKYKKVIFLGTSAGGYAAILFGSLLKVNTVAAFMPQTILEKEEKYDEKYLNLKKFINKETKYFIYGNLSSTDKLHHINHLINLENIKNVYLFKRETLKIKEMRDSGELLKILDNIINEKNE